MNGYKQIFVKMPAGNTLTFDIDNSTTVGDLKKFIFRRTNLPSTWQRFVCNGKAFDKNHLNLIYDLDIKKECTLHAFLRFHGVGCKCETCPSKNILLRSGKRV
jgi:hypothetical protein